LTNVRSPRCDAAGSSTILDTISTLVNQVKNITGAEKRCAIVIHRPVFNEDQTVYERLD